MIPALVLTAGLGTRSRPLSLFRAKAALPVAGEPLVRRILRWLAGHAIEDAVLNLHHLPETITAVVGDGSDVGVCVRYSWEQPVVLGSAGGPRHALDLLGSRTFFVINGDTLTDVDLRSVAERHRASGARLTLALVPNPAPLHYGGVLVNDDGYVTGFVRRGPSAAGSYHFIGVQVANADVFEPLEDNEPASSIGGVYDALLSDRGAIAAHLSTAAFWDVGTPDDYLATSLAFAGGDPAVLCRGRNVAVAASARVADSVLWDDVTVEDGCSLTRCIVTDGVRVPGGSRHESVILMQGADGLSVIPL